MSTVRRLATAIAATALALTVTPAAHAADLAPGRIVGPSVTVDRERIVYTERGPAGTGLLVVEWNDGRIVAYPTCKHPRSPRCWNPKRDTVRAFHRTHRLTWIGEPGLILTD